MKISVREVLPVGSLNLQSSKRGEGTVKAFPDLVTHPTFLRLALGWEFPLFVPLSADRLAVAGDFSWSADCGLP